MQLVYSVFYWSTSPWLGFRISSSFPVWLEVNWSYHRHENSPQDLESISPFVSRDYVVVMNAISWSSVCPIEWGYSRWWVQSDCDLEAMQGSSGTAQGSIPDWEFWPRGLSFTADNDWLAVFKTSGLLLISYSTNGGAVSSRWYS